MIIDQLKNNRSETKEIIGAAMVYLGSFTTTLGGCKPEIKRCSAATKEPWQISLRSKRYMTSSYPARQDFLKL